SQGRTKRSPSLAGCTTWFDSQSRNSAGTEIEHHRTWDKEPTLRNGTAPGFGEKRKAMTPITAPVEGMFKTFFQESGDALFLFDPETEQVVDVNPMAQRMCGLPQPVLLSMPLPCLFRSEEPGGLHRLRDAVCKHLPFHSQEGFLLRQHKAEAWLSINLTVSRLSTESRTLG